MLLSDGSVIFVSSVTPFQAKSFVVLDEDVLKVVPAKEQVKALELGELNMGVGTAVPGWEQRRGNPVQRLQQRFPE